MTYFDCISVGEGEGWRGLSVSVANKICGCGHVEMNVAFDVDAIILLVVLIQLIMDYDILHPLDNTMLCPPSHQTKCHTYNNTTNTQVQQILHGEQKHPTRGYQTPEHRPTTTALEILRIILLGESDEPRRRGSPAARQARKDRRRWFRDHTQSRHCRSQREVGVRRSAVWQYGEEEPVASREEHHGDRANSGITAGHGDVAHHVRIQTGEGGIPPEQAGLLRFLPPRPRGRRLAPIVHEGQGNGELPRRIQQCQPVRLCHLRDYRRAHEQGPRRNRPGRYSRT